MVVVFGGGTLWETVFISALDTDAWPYFFPKTATKGLLKGTFSWRGLIRCGRESFGLPCSCLSRGGRSFGFPWGRSVRRRLFPRRFASVLVRLCAPARRRSFRPDFFVHRSRRSAPRFLPRGGAFFSGPRFNLMIRCRIAHLGILLQGKRDALPLPVDGDDRHLNDLPDFKDVSGVLHITGPRPGSGGRGRPGGRRCPRRRRRP